MLKEINKKIILCSGAIIVLTIILNILSNYNLFITFNLLDAIIGILAGTLLSIIRFKLLNDSIMKVVEMDKDVAMKMGTISYINRYFITAVLLIIAILYKLDTFVAMAITLVLATQFSARSVKTYDVDKEVKL